MAMASLSKACRPMLRVDRGMALWQTAGHHRRPRPGTGVHGIACAGCTTATGSRMMCPPSGASGCFTCAASLWRSVPWATCESWAALGDALFGPISASSDDIGNDSNSSSGSSTNDSSSSNSSSSINISGSSSSSSSILRTLPATAISEAVAESLAERALVRMISRWRALKLAEERLTNLISIVFKTFGLLALVAVVCAVVSPITVRNSNELVVRQDMAQLWSRVSGYGGFIIPLLPFVWEYGATCAVLFGSMGPHVLYSVHCTNNTAHVAPYSCTVHGIKHTAQHILCTYTAAAVRLLEQLSGYAVEPAEHAVEGAAGSTAAANDSSAGNNASDSRLQLGLS